MDIPGKTFDSYMDIPGKSGNEHLLAGSMSLQQLFPNSHQVWGLLLTRFTFVLASIFGKSATVLGVRLGNRPSSWCVDSRAVWGGVAGRWSGGVAGQ